MQDFEKDSRLSRGNFEDALSFQARVFPPDLMSIERTPELWVKKKTADQPTLLI